jgi:ABC-type transporter Mla subunit MlaD
MKRFLTGGLEKLGGVVQSGKEVAGKAITATTNTVTDAASRTADTIKNTAGQAKDLASSGEKIISTVSALKAKLQTTPKLGDALREVLRIVRALRAVSTSEEAVDLVRELEAELKGVKSYFGDDATTVHAVLDAAIGGLATVLAKGAGASPDFLVGVGIDAIDPHLKLIETVLSFCLE